jgi:hypothetical protein
MTITLIAPADFTTSATSVTFPPAFAERRKHDFSAACRTPIHLNPKARCGHCGNIQSLVPSREFGITRFICQGDNRQDGSDTGLCRLPRRSDFGGIPQCTPFINLHMQGARPGKPTSPDITKNDLSAPSLAGVARE